MSEYNDSFSSLPLLLSNFTLKLAAASAVAAKRLSMVDMSAARRVFAVAELADAIFLHLTPSELLTSAQQVCKSWQVAIVTSSALQEMLFFKPISVSHPQLQYFDISATWRDGTYNSRELPVIENPFAILLSHPIPAEAFQRGTASWRRMLLSQPPIRKLSYCTKEDWNNTTVRSCGDGVKLGDLVSPLYGMKGSSSWIAFTNYEQLQALKGHLKANEEVFNLETLEDADVEWEEWLAELRWRCCSAWDGCV